MRQRLAEGIRVVDLFAGVGGFALGFLAANQELCASSRRYELTGLVDHDTDAAYTFKRNLPQLPYHVMDLRRAAASDLVEMTSRNGSGPDIVIGGPPCQGFSRLGPRVSEDTRNALLLRFLRLAAKMQPGCIVLENVPHIEHSGLTKKCIQLLRKEKYDARVAILRAEDFGVPQLRKRAFLVAVRRSILAGRDIPIPAPTTVARYVTAAEAIDDLPVLATGGGADPCGYGREPDSPYQTARRNGCSFVFNHVARRHNPAFLAKIAIIPEGGRNLELPSAMRFSDGYFSQAYARLTADRPAYTITTCFLNPGSGRFLHYRALRSISPREAARLQSFDDSFIFHGPAFTQARHIGNAVPPLLAKAWARALHPLFD